MHATFEEESAAPPTAALPMAHLSIEVGHLYLSDVLAGDDRLRDLAHRVAPWLAAARQACADALAPRRARISTCYLIDEYSAAIGSPAEILPVLLDAARDAGFTIDYLARESACAQADVPLAALVLDHIVADPPPGTDGARPVAHRSGWLCNGVRSPTTGRREAMAPPTPWQPPAENGANPHSIFVDVQLWDETSAGRRWSCAFLAAVWQLLRLGALRRLGQPVVAVTDWSGPFPPAWSELPPVIRLEPRAQPFTAFRTLSIVDNGFLPVEHAVRTILSQVAVAEAVTDQLRRRAGDEDLALPTEVVDRLAYTFLAGAWS